MRFASMAAALSIFCSCGGSPPAVQATTSNSTAPASSEPAAPVVPSAAASPKPKPGRTDGDYGTPGEAKVALSQIAKSMAAAYEREQLESVLVAPGAKSAVIHVLCPSARQIPDRIPESGKKYQSDPLGWGKDPGWSCLRFEINAPQLFQYEVKTDARTQTFTAIARRRDGTELLEYSVMGQVRAGTTELALNPLITEKRFPFPHP